MTGIPGKARARLGTIAGRAGMLPRKCATPSDGRASSPLALAGVPTCPGCGAPGARRAARGPAPTYTLLGAVPNEGLAAVQAG